jgi:hypothetical protein
MGRAEVLDTPRPAPGGVYDLGRDRSRGSLHRAHVGHRGRLQARLARKSTSLSLQTCTSALHPGKPQPGQSGYTGRRRRASDQVMIAGQPPPDALGARNSSLTLSAADHYPLAGNPARILAGEKCHHIRHISRLAQPTE